MANLIETLQKFAAEAGRAFVGPFEVKSKPTAPVLPGGTITREQVQRMIDKMDESLKTEINTAGMKGAAKMGVMYNSKDVLGAFAAEIAPKIAAEPAGTLEEWPTASWEGDRIQPDPEALEVIRAASAAMGGTLDDVAEAVGYTREPSKPQPEIDYMPGNDLNNRQEIERANGVIEALRIRCRDKAASNGRLSQKYNVLQQREAEQSRDLQLVIEENRKLKDGKAFTLNDMAELETENRRLVDQLTESDAMRRDMGEEAERLSVQLEEVARFNESYKKEIARLNAKKGDKKELKRAYKIIDLLLEKSGF